VPTAAGGFLPLSTVTDSRLLSTPRAIVRRDKRMSRTITLELEEGTEEKTRERLTALTAGIDLPEGIYLGVSSAPAELDEDLAGLQFAAAMSVVFIYLLMGFLFESFILPLSIILTIPLASIGVIWIHILTGRDIDFLGAVGIVLLIGVVVNNGIVLIDYVNRLRARGVDRLEALRLSAERRFRPIMMTAITTIGGLLPLALAGRADSGISYTSFALTLIGGMTTATLLTLLVVPVFYTFFDDLRESFTAALRSVQRLAASHEDAQNVPEHQGNR
jgi:HAE1 family hydrophobic/amphiphilic exporter-1